MRLTLQQGQQAAEQTVELRRAVFKCTASVGGAQGRVQRIGVRASLLMVSTCECVIVKRMSGITLQHVVIIFAHTLI